MAVQFRYDPVADTFSFVPQGENDESIATYLKDEKCDDYIGASERLKTESFINTFFPKALPFVEEVNQAMAAFYESLASEESS